MTQAVVVDHKAYTTLEKGSRGPVMRPGCSCGWSHWERFSSAELAFQLAEAHAAAER